MDKLYFYVLQTDWMLPTFLQGAEECATLFLTNETMTAMDRPSTAGLMVACNDSRSREEEDDDNLMDRNDLFDGTEEPADSLDINEWVEYIWLFCCIQMSRRWH